MREKIQDLCFDSQPTHLIIDLRKLSSTAFNIFGRALILNAVFPTSLKILRKLKAGGLQANYNNDEVDALKIRCLPALAFVALMDDKEYFEAAIEHLATISQFLVLYFEYTYIGRTLPADFHQELMFHIEMWNQHQ